MSTKKDLTKQYTLNQILVDLHRYFLSLILLVNFSTLCLGELS